MRRRMFNAIHVASGFKVDFIVEKQRPFSAEELERRRLGTLGGREVAYASVEDTILTKLEWALHGDSERQYSDAAGLARVHQARLDEDYLERWSSELGVSELLARARDGKPFRG